LQLALPRRNPSRGIVGVMQAAGVGGTEMTWGADQDPWAGKPDDDEYPDFLWPDDDDEQDKDEQDKDEQDEDRPAGARQPGQPAGIGAEMPGEPLVPFQWPLPPAPAYPHNASGRTRRIVTLAVTAAVAVGLGAGAVVVYRHAQAASTPAAAASQNATPPPPGRSGGPAGQGVVQEMEMVATVTAVGSDTITIGGGPVQPVRAEVTSATRFTGSVRSLSGVKVGNDVAAVIIVENGVAKVATLQDPASDS
jgi:hypothetical protein